MFTKGVSFGKRHTPIGAVVAIVFSWQTPVLGTGLTIHERTHDFGVIDDQVEAIHEFRIWNQGDRAVRILSARPSCAACIRAVDYPPVLQPTERGVVKMALSGRGKRGPVTSRLLIVTDDPKREQIVLEARAFVRGAALDPSHVAFGEVQGGETYDETVVVSCYGLGKFTVEWSIIGGEVFSLTLAEPETGPAHVQNPDSPTSIRRVPLRVTCDARQLTPGSISAEARIMILGTEKDWKKMVRLPMLAFVLGRYVCDPSRINFGTVRPGGTVTRRCALKMQDLASGPIVAGAESSAVTVVQDSGRVKQQEGEYVLACTFDAKKIQKPGLVRGTLQIRSAQSQQVIACIPWIAFVPRPAATSDSNR
ncbi:MAG TPA: DUF1573 domain-containing protein [Phycisphaerae bacterium]|nr:DUF1573 domain-containing protein [Phycisphaerae bacterium]